MSYSGGLERHCRSKYIPLSRVSHEDSILKAFASRFSCSSRGMECQECRRDKGDAGTWAEQPRVRCWEYYIIRNLILLGQKLGKSAKRFSIEERGVRVRGAFATGGWALLERGGAVGSARLTIYPSSSYLGVASG